MSKESKKFLLCHLKTQMGIQQSVPRKVYLKRAERPRIRAQVFQRVDMDEQWQPTAQSLEQILVQTTCTVSLDVNIDKSNLFHNDLPILQIDEVVHAYLGSVMFLDHLKHLFKGFQNVNVNVVSHENENWYVSLTADLILPQSEQSLVMIDDKLQEIARSAVWHIPETHVQIRLFDGLGKKSLHASGLMCQSANTEQWRVMDDQLEQWKREQMMRDADLQARLQMVDAMV